MLEGHSAWANEGNQLMDRLLVFMVSQSIAQPGKSGGEQSGGSCVGGTGVVIGGTGDLHDNGPATIAGDIPSSPGSMSEASDPSRGRGDCKCPAGGPRRSAPHRGGKATHTPCLIGGSRL